MQIMCIGDTHGFHEQLKIPSGIDMLIHCGDIGNVKSPEINANECTLALIWLDSLDIKYKILIAGNHDTAIEARMVDPKAFKSIIYLEHDVAEVAGQVIFGSPYVPEYYHWAFNVRRDRLSKYWEAIPKETNILVTHGPPKGILDLALDKDKQLEFCGDKALATRSFEVCPELHVFGHIHNNNHIMNQGTRKIGDITFVNASAVTDQRFDYGLTSQGVIIEQTKQKLL